MSESVDGNAGLSTLRTIADYQFGAGAGAALFPDTADSAAAADTDELTIKRTSSGRPQQVHAEAGRIVSFGIDGRFTLGLEGGRRLARVLESPAYRVIVDDESEPFVRDEKNVFTKFVLDAGEEIRPGDEVLVVHERGELLAVGRAELDAASIADFETGMAVNVREGAPASE
ncbi:PUA domain-containing protein [Natrialba hulunbeirensis JCM 10989]|uniref:PUA domain-containing protein n=1 Tax=Natrialba hulunbeirensis JCM 10989 TaxID=1227493 RepID=L9ZU10_9EURY|nr:PUA domain-containing protein [Natrialba hulunbeirensis]ELY89032.1 PUA domain-containing protein [Natrialba hulunbeirensis JCM 10989]